MDANTLRSIFSHIPGYFCLQDDGGYVVWCNAKFCQLVGLADTKEIIGKNLSSLDFDAKFLKFIIQSKKTIASESIKEQRFKAQYAKPNGNSLSLLAELVLIDSETHDQKLFLLSCTDVTEDAKKIKQYEAEKNQTNDFFIDLGKQVTGRSNAEMAPAEQAQAICEYYRSIIANMPGTIYWLGKDEHVLLGGNQNLADIFGLESYRDLTGLTYDEMAELANWTEGQGESFRQAEVLVMNSGEGRYNVKEPAVIIDGETRYYVSNKVPLRDKSGNVNGVLGISLDMTELVEYEQQLEHEKKLSEQASQAKSEFIANMSHDIRTPITGILGLTQFLYDETGEEKLREKIKLLEGSVSEILNMLNDILDTVAVESGQVSTEAVEFNLRSLIQKRLVMFKSAAIAQGIDLMLAYPVTLPHNFVGSKAIIDRVMLNLIGNALKFTAEGFIKVEVSCAEQSKDSMTLQIKVEDSGIGIDESKFDIIFQNFSRLTPSYKGVYKGTGMGLYMVKKYLEVLQGDIQVESQVGKGSVFTIKFPVQVSSNVLLEESNSIVDADELSSETNATTDLKFLLVEDNELAAWAAIQQIKSLGYDSVDMAVDGTTALEKIKSHDYDFIFMDIGLPDMSGIEVAKVIRSLSANVNKDIPIVALTGHVGKDSRHTCIDAGMNDVISKPANAASIRTVLEKFIPDVVSNSVSFDSDQDDQDDDYDDEPPVLPVIDLALGAERLGGTEEGARDTLGMLKETLLEDQAAMKLAYDKGDLKGLYALIHKFYGGLCYCGAPRLQAVTLRLKELVYDENREGLSECYAGFNRELEVLYRVLKAEGI